MPSIFAAAAVVIPVRPAVIHRQAFTLAIITFLCLNVTRRVSPPSTEELNHCDFFLSILQKPNQIPFFSTTILLPAKKRE